MHDMLNSGAIAYFVGKQCAANDALQTGEKFRSLTNAQSEKLKSLLLSSVLRARNAQQVVATIEAASLKARGPWETWAYEM